MRYSITTKQLEDGTRDIIAKDSNGNSFILSELCPQEREQRLLDSALTEYARHDESLGFILFGIGSGLIAKALEERSIPYLILDIEDIEQIENPEKKDSEAIKQNKKTKDSQEQKVDSNSTETIKDYKSILQSKIFQWQILNKGISFIPIIHPFHKKLYKEYSEVAQSFASNIKCNIFKTIRNIPRFERNRPTRMLVIPDYYCMIANITNAASMLGVETRDVLLTDHNITEEWYVNFLKTAVDFKPDFILTFNHLGVSENYNGCITNLAESLGIPIASWFVDSPDVLIGYEDTHISSLIHVFLWEETRVQQVKDMGYQASYLPLAADPRSFYPVQKKKIPHHLKCYKSSLLFVGAVGVEYANKILSRTIFPYKLYTLLPELYQEYIRSPLPGVKEFLDKKDIPEYHNLPNIDKKEFSAYLFFYMHTRRRVQFMLDIIDLKPTIAGVEGWNDVLPEYPTSSLLPSVDYIYDLTCVYQLADVNLNITSPQMKHAVNQRVFDVPLSEAFLLTDNQPALSDFFEIGKEVIVYNSVEEFKDLYTFYIKKPNERRKIIQAGRKRVLNEHLYIHRLQQLIDTMRAQFGF